MPNQISVSGDCCNTSCQDSPVSQVPGPAGNNGAAGANGTNGIDAFTTTTALFAMPIIGNSVLVAVADSAWIALGQVIFVQNAGYFTATGLPNTTSVSLTNLGYTGNVAPATNVAGSSKVSPGGLIGATGSSGVNTLNGISPTTNKGDLIADNGANSPLASDIRVGVGTDGKELTADSSQAAGISWKQNQPNTATDNAVPRFDGAAGTPVPLQTSKLIVTDNGAVQASGSGGNARGTDAIDLQVTRALVTQIAGGANSVVGGGENNKVTAADSVVCGGSTNSVTNAQSVIVGGYNNTVSGYQSAVCGGDTNTISDEQIFIGGGALNNAAGKSSVICGGVSNATIGEISGVPGGIGAVAFNYGQQSVSSGPFAAGGDSQKSELIWRKTTVDATVGVELFLDGGISNLRASITVGKTWGFEIILVGRSFGGAAAVWEAKGGIQNNAGTTALLAAVTPVVLADGTGGTWGLAANFIVAADDTNDTLKLSVTGAGATNIRWTAHARIVEVGY